MGSLKLKLVVYFSLIALMPFAAALSGLQSITDRSETRRADGILETGVRAGLARFSDEVASAQRRAAELARDPSFQRALSRRDRRVLRRALAKQPNLRLEARGLTFGSSTRPAIERSVAVQGRHGPLGRVVAGVRLDDSLAARVRRNACLGWQDEVSDVGRSGLELDRVARPDVVRGQILTGPDDD